MKNSIYLGCAVFLMMECQTKNLEATPPPPPPPAPAPPMEMSGAARISDDLTVSAERGVFMKGGAMIMMQDCSIVPMNKNMILENGDTVMTTGEIIHKDGSKTKMQEGMMIDKSGTIVDKDGMKVDPSR